MSMQVHAVPAGNSEGPAQLMYMIYLAETVRDPFQFIKESKVPAEGDCLVCHKHIVRETEPMYPYPICSVMLLKSDEGDYEVAIATTVIWTCSEECLTVTLENCRDAQLEKVAENVEDAKNSEQ